MAQDPWAVFNPQPAPAGGGGAPSAPIVSPTKSVSPAEAARLDLQRRSVEVSEGAAVRATEKDAFDLAEKQEKAARIAKAQEEGVRDSKNQIRNVITAAKKAKALSDDFFATGFGAKKAREWGGTSAADVEGLLETIGSNTAFDRLQKMREQSPTGGALGNVTEMELRLLQSSIASLNQSQSDAQFQANMDIVIDNYQRVLDRLEGREPADGAATGDQSDDEFAPGIGPGGGLVGSVTDDTPPQEGLPGLVTLGKQGITLGLSDEAAGVGGAIANVLLGRGDIAGGYRRERDRERALIDQAREQWGGAGTAVEVLGGGALGKVAQGLSGLRAGRAVAARGAPVTRGAIQGQMARQMGVEGAAVGAAGGYGYGEGAEGSAAGTVAGAVLGGAIGAGGQRLGNGIANRGRGAVANTSGAEIQTAADAMGIPVTPAVTGGTVARRLTGGARQGFISDQPIAKAVDAMETAGGEARDRIASQTGRVLDNEDAGNVVRDAANVYSKRTSQIGGNLYTRADRMAAGVTLPLPKAVAKADEWLAKIAKSAEGEQGTLYKDIKTLRDQMASRSFEVEGIKQTRTALREQIQERGLRGSVTDKVYGDILDEAADDLFDGLNAAGKANAAGALKTANAFWKKRVETIDKVLEPVLGRDRSGEQIVTAVENLAKPKTGNNARLRQLVKAMPKDEANSLAATLITRMGQPTAGSAASTGFSFNTFLTNWNNMSPRARASIFPKATVDALDQLATVSQGVKQAGTAMNTSNTAGALGVQAAMTLPLLAFVEPMTAVGATVGQYGVGRLLASPKVARWIARAPKKPNRAYVAQLGGIARAEPAIANEIGIFQQALLRGANDNPAASLAAEEQNVEEN